MKKTIALLAGIVLRISAGWAWAAGVEAEEQWHEITRDGFGQDVLTVRLDSNPSTGFDWSFDISDPELLELLTMEFVPDSNDLTIVGAGGEWVASFRNFSGKTGEVVLTFSYARPWEETPIDVRTLTVAVDEHGRIEIIQNDEPEDVAVTAPAQDGK